MVTTLIAPLTLIASITVAPVMIATMAAVSPAVAIGRTTSHTGRQHSREQHCDPDSHFDLPSPRSPSTQNGQPNAGVPINRPAEHWSAALRNTTIRETILEMTEVAFRWGENPRRALQAAASHMDRIVVATFMGEGISGAKVRHGGCDRD
ncbi:MAG: hypothetical protein JWQ97_770 [Phenylobacterium sp.]|nr:hypothetical protein [Phenylobacterium sp.]